MAIGKLTNTDLNNLIMKHLQTKRKDIVLSSSVGEDCAAIDFGQEVCVLSTDPITGATENLGKLAVNICCNDIASSGAESVGLLLTLLCPLNTTNDEIETILSDAAKEAEKLNVDIIGGHTERTSAVNRIVISGTAIGRVSKDKLIRTGAARPGDYIYMSKWAGLEGTGIIVSEKRATLEDVLTSSEMLEAAAYLDDLNVIPESNIAIENGVTAMHDATEGGILGAVYEMCEASDLGCEIHHHRIAVKSITEKLCDHYLINPLRLISSGVMLMAIPPSYAGEFEKGMIEAEIPYTKIGTMTEIKDRILIYGKNELEEVKETIAPPEGDELYKVIE